MKKGLPERKQRRAHRQARKETRGGSKSHKRIWKSHQGKGGKECAYSQTQPGKEIFLAPETLLLLAGTGKGCYLCKKRWATKRKNAPPSFPKKRKAERPPGKRRRRKSKTRGRGIPSKGKSKPPRNGRNKAASRSCGELGSGGVQKGARNTPTLTSSRLSAPESVPHPRRKETPTSHSSGSGGVVDYEGGEVGGDNTPTRRKKSTAQMGGVRNAIALVLDSVFRLHQEGKIKVSTSKNDICQKQRKKACKRWNCACAFKEAPFPGGGSKRRTASKVLRDRRGKFIVTRDGAKVRIPEKKECWEVWRGEKKSQAYSRRRTRRNASISRKGGVRDSLGRLGENCIL